MNNDLEKQFSRKLIGEGFIKVTEKPTQTLSSEEKALLNRKGNVFFNEGNIQMARRVFLATGYSDGLTRVGDSFLKQGDELSALKMYWLAHNKSKSSALIQKAANIVSALISDESPTETTGDMN